MAEPRCSKITVPVGQAFARVTQGPNMKRELARCFFRLLALLAVAAGATAARAADAVWQWSTPVNAVRSGYGPAVAYLWIPPECPYVRGIVIGQNNMEESSILENPILRRALAEEGLAEIYASPAFNLFFDFSQGAGEQLTDILGKLADLSGYQEIRFAPLVGIGHSAAASYPYYLGAWAPPRTLACISVSGQWPYFRGEPFAPDIWGTRTLDGVPCLETMGEFEAAVNVGAAGVRDRQAHPRLPLSMLALPGQGHFASTDEKVRFLALYIRKAVQYRLPPDTPAGQPPVLKPVDPTKTGWLADRWRGTDASATATPAPVGQYTGDAAQAFWYFDEETAKADAAIGAQHHGKKTQLVGILQDEQLLPQTTQHLQLFPKWEPQADGITFRLTGAFYDTVPGPANARPAGWVGVPPGTPIGHATGGGPVAIDRVAGPFEKVSADTFRLKLERGLGADIKQYELILVATHPGDAQYKPAVQQAQLNVPLRVTQGAAQAITFPPIPDQKAGAGPITLGATSSAAVSVSYYVREGPAEVDGNRLTLTPIPPRARYPVKVTVVAWQYGHAAAPPLKSADPVERSFLIHKDQVP
jgi:hypothetical protein